MTIIVTTAENGVIAIFTTSKQVKKTFFTVNAIAKYLKLWRKINEN